MKQPVDFGFRNVSKLLRQLGLNHVPPDAIVLCEKVVEKPTMLENESTFTLGNVKKKKGSVTQIFAAEMY